MTTLRRVRSRVIATAALATLAALDRSPRPADAATAKHHRDDSQAQPRILAALPGSSTTSTTATPALSTTTSTSTTTPRTSTTALVPSSSATTSGSSATASGPTGPTGPSGPSGPSGSTGSGHGSGGPAAAGGPHPQAITGRSRRPASHKRSKSKHKGSGKGTSAGSGSGKLAPPPTLNEAANPLDGVLPGGFSTLPGPGTNVPNFFIQSYHVPVFLLPIYQAAASTYGIPWQVLAAINEVETDYGTDQNLSSAGAEGWMQFLPAEWSVYGVDATGSGVADPYNPADAIFAAARYLKAAGGQTNIKNAIFAYNHSNAYVQSVLLRAELLTGLPSTMVDALSNLANGHFPIQPHDQPTYAPSGSSDPASQATGASPSAASAAASSASAAALPAASGLQSGTTDTATSARIYADANAAVVAVQDGVVSKIGWSRRIGRYVQLRDAHGNTYTYGNLASIEPMYPVPIPPSPKSAPRPSDASPVPGAPAPTASATAGDHPPPSGTTGPGGATGATGPTNATPTPASSPATTTAGLASDFEFGSLAHPLAALLSATATAPTRKTATTTVRHRRAPAKRPATGSAVDPYFTSVFGLTRHQLELATLRPGSQVLAGTLLGRLGSGTAKAKPSLVFELRPAGAGAKLIDPRPFLDSWSQLETTLLHRRTGLQPLVGPDSLAASAGRVILLSKSDLQRVVLADPHIRLDACARADINDGRVDRRVLATLEYLVVSGLDPTVAKVKCNANGLTTAADATIDDSDASVDITAVNGIPILGHQGSGSITQTTILRLLELQGSMYPAQIVSLKSFPGAENTIALPDHADRIEIVFSSATTATTATAASAPLGLALSPSRWSELVERLQDIAQPSISPVRSSASVADPGVPPAHSSRAATTSPAGIAKPHHG